MEILTMGRWQVMPLRERPNPLAQDRTLHHLLPMKKHRKMLQNCSEMDCPYGECELERM